MVAIYKEKESYKKLREFQDKTSEPGLATPRCDVPKRTWEKKLGAELFWEFFFFFREFFFFFWSGVVLGLSRLLFGKTQG